MRSMRPVSLAVTAFLLALLAAPVAGSGRGDLVRWRPPTQGMAEAGRNGKPILYFFTADWCGPCHIMKSEVFSDKEMADLIEKEYVPIEVLDRSREEGTNAVDVDKLLAKFEVRGFPTLVLTRAKSAKAVYVTGWSGRESVVRFLKDGKKQLKDMEKGR